MEVEMAQGMKPMHFATLPLLVVALMLTGSAGTAAGDEPPETADPALNSYLPLVAEFDLRRRVNVLFPNPQTLFDGLPVGFVNVGSGNLTFLRRDLVTRANGPLVLGRVYDSRFQGDGDFGPGWRLSLTEELVIGTDSVAYVDRTGARRRFVANADALCARQAHAPSCRHQNYGWRERSDDVRERRHDADLQAVRRRGASLARRQCGDELATCGLPLPGWPAVLGCPRHTHHVHHSA